MAADAGYEEILSACGTQEGDARVIDLARVGVFPGPRAVDTVKDPSQVIAVLLSLMEAFDYKPFLMDVYASAATGAKDAAEGHKLGVRAMLQATFEYLFPRKDPGGLRVVVGKAVLFSTALPAARSSAAGAAAAPAAAVHTTPAPAAAPPGPVATPAPAPAAATADGGEGSKKRSHEELDAVDSLLDEASRKPAAGETAGDTAKPLYEVTA